MSDNASTALSPNTLATTTIYGGAQQRKDRVASAIVNYTASMKNQRKNNMSLTRYANESGSAGGNPTR